MGGGGGVAETGSKFPKGPRPITAKLVPPSISIILTPRTGWVIKISDIDSLFSLEGINTSYVQTGYVKSINNLTAIILTCCPGGVVGTTAA